ncbi:hypothetical protein BT63DRAFT_60541 [Microthyrium microscopicum]|uniref:Uncharacterized protein n=1 Tax=Microthyrium microscopicum TaxID=703497 RepID=A0A6A6TYW7_9PEZI|nr:hypothetical protein BT63DRAFT_60541 [Microthyrium microscopicum]
MERAIGRTAQSAEDVCSGLQLFLDNIPQRDAGIYESIHELLSLARGLGELRLDAVQYKRLPTPIEKDIRIFLESMNLTLGRVQNMFGETKLTKLNGEIAYSHIWNNFSMEMDETVGGGLWPRLELYNLFLKAMLENVRGETVEPKSLGRHRQKITRLLQSQQPSEPGYPSDTSSPISPHVSFPPMPPAWPGGPPAPSFPFPGSLDMRQYGPSSPTISTASWSTHTSGSMNSASNHWASFVFTGRHDSTPFPAALRRQSIVYGRPMPSALDRLAEDNYSQVSRIAFEADDMEARFYCRSADARARILLLKRDSAGALLFFCIPLTALKLTRDAATLDLYRMDRQQRKYEIWASLNFADYERLVLAYSTFAALKNQDAVMAPEGLHDDYFHTNAREEKLLFGGITVYPPSRRHALRLFRDTLSGGLRFEARPLRGPKMHVPLWTAFVAREVHETGWVRRVGGTQLELKRLDQHIFVDGYIPTLGRSGRFVIDFDSRDDCDSFIRAIKEARMD